MYQGWTGLVNDSVQGTGAGAVLNTATTATLSPTAGGADVAQIPPAWQPNGWDQGLVLFVIAQGLLNTTTTSTTFTPLLAARVGNTGATYVTLASAGAIATGTTAFNLQWTLWALIRCTNVAASGNTIATQGVFEITNNATVPTIGAVTNGVLLRAPLPQSAGENAVAVDVTQLQGISLRGILAGANATVQLTQWAVLQVN